MTRNSIPAKAAERIATSGNAEDKSAGDALGIASRAAVAAFAGHYDASESAGFAWSLRRGQAIAPWYNRRGVEFLVLEKGAATLNGRPLQVGHSVRIDPGMISEVKTTAGARIVSHIFPYRSVFCHLDYTNLPVEGGRVLVSLVVIAKDIENYIAQCVTSCLVQTYSNIEVIVAVDASKDATLQRCRDLLRFDERIKIVSSDRPLGANGARRLGLKRAQGDFCLMLDGDDWISIDAVERLVEVATSQRADCVVFGFDHHNDKTRVVWDPVLPTTAIVSEGPLFYSREAHWALGVSTLNHTVWMYFFSARLRQIAISSLPDIPLYEDLPFFLTLIEHAEQTAVANQILYHYRRDRVGQATHDWFTVPVGLKLSCLELAVNHALAAIRSDHWFYQLILLYKVQNIILFERKVCRTAKDVEAAVAWDRYWLRLMAKFPASLAPLITDLPTRKRFKMAKRPVLRALKFHRNARLLREKR